jgi:hypothetical protein
MYGTFCQSTKRRACGLFQENASLEMVEEEQKKIIKHEALQLLKKKEKADNIIKVSQIFTRNPCAWH